VKPTTRSLGWLWALALLAVPSTAAAQPWTGIIDPSRVIDWSLGEAGVAGGIPNRTFNCATIAAYTGSAATINNALSACANNTSALAAGGGVVNLQAGTFNLTSGINLSGISNVTLRGAGANQTKLVMTGSVSCFFGGSVCVGNSTPQTAATDGAGGTPAWVSNWTAGYAQGTTVITLASTANVSVGDVIVLDQTDDTSDTGNIYVCQHTTGTGPNGSPCSLEGGSYGRQGPPVRSQTQLVRVTAKNGTNLTITPGLYMPNWSASKNPQAYGIGPNNGQNTGIENLSIDHTRSGAGDGAFVIVNGYNNWIKGVRSLTIPAVMGGGNPSQLAHIWMLQTARFEVRDSYLYGVPDGQSRNYGLLYQSTTNILNVNNISQHVSNPHMLGTDVGSVSAFNYSADNWSTEAGGGQMPAIFDQHAAGLSMHLFEGNQGNQWNGDTFHGSANLNTVFRNLFIGQNPEVVSPRKSNCTTPITLLSYVTLQFRRQHPGFAGHAYELSIHRGGQRPLAPRRARPRDDRVGSRQSRCLRQSRRRSGPGDVDRPPRPPDAPALGQLRFGSRLQRRQLPVQRGRGAVRPGAVLQPRARRPRAARVVVPPVAAIVVGNSLGRPRVAGGRPRRHRRRLSQLRHVGVRRSRLSHPRQALLRPHDSGPGLLIVEPPGNRERQPRRQARGLQRGDVLHGDARGAPESADGNPGPVRNHCPMNRAGR